MSLTQVELSIDRCPALYPVWSGLVWLDRRGTPSRYNN
jgi:hypothetical protein